MRAVKILLLLNAVLEMADFALAQTWTLTSAPNLNWVAVASSADGLKLAAIVEVLDGPLSPPANPIYVSTNAGTTWIPRGAELSGLGWNWNYLAASADGSQLLVAAFRGALYISKDSGITWYMTGPPSALWSAYNWSSVASSPDGTKLVATAYGGEDSINNGMVFISTNSGATWNRATTTFDTCWSIAFANGGNELIAGVMDDAIYTSPDSGSTWSATGSTNELFWSIASSADGSHLAASSFLSGHIYTSKDAGTTWTSANAPNVTWQAIASSADGSKLVAAANVGSVFTSTDSGATWNVANAPSTNWISVASSADGNTLVAAVKGGGIWITQTSPTPQLNITTSSTNLTLSWTIPSTNFVLQQSSDLFLWSDVTNLPMLNPTNLLNEVSLPPSGSNAFYRLKSP